MLSLKAFIKLRFGFKHRRPYTSNLSAINIRSPRNKKVWNCSRKENFSMSALNRFPLHYAVFCLGTFQNQTGTSCSHKRNFCVCFLGPSCRWFSEHQIKPLHLILSGISEQRQEFLFGQGLFLIQL